MPFPKKLGDLKPKVSPELLAVAAVAPPAEARELTGIKLRFWKLVMTWLKELLSSKSWSWKNKKKMTLIYRNRYFLGTYKGIRRQWTRWWKLQVVKESRGSSRRSWWGRSHGMPATDDWIEEFIRRSFGHFYVVVIVWIVQKRQCSFGTEMLLSKGRRGCHCCFKIQSQKDFFFRFRPARRRRF